ncbi:MAG TPA: 16S rRNA (uracil(1498)-N(3))-methyltransferase [Chitinivibrionales bacterium]
MNLILLFETDFLDGNPACARLTGRRREHVVSVCNASVGSTFRVGMVNGKMGNGEVISLTPKSIDFRVTLDTQPPKSLPLTLIVGLPRPKSFLRCVEAATVLGVKTIFFMHSFRVEKNYWSNQKLSDEKIGEQAVLGLEQARDTMMPRIELRRRFKPFVEDELPALARSTTALVAHPYTAAACPYKVAGPITLIIGPEGGFIPYEIDMLTRQGFQAVSFGERILRVEHAIPALIGRLT